MVFRTVANLKGPKGDQGEQGLPGVNAVANDTATAGYVNSGGSATRTALNKYFPPIARDVYDEYTTGADDADLTGHITDSGSAITLLNDGNGNFRITGGLLVHPIRTNGSQTAAYMGVVLSERVREFWIEVIWIDDGKTGDALAAMVVSEDPFTPPFPNAAAHVLFERDGWTYQTYSSGPNTIDAGSYAPLPYGVLHRFGLTLAADVATLHLPDGTTVTITDADIADWAGPYATVESFALGNNNPVGFSRWNASAAVSMESSRSDAAAAAAGKFIKTGSDVETTLDGTFKVVDTMSIVVPASRSLNVVAREWVSMTVAGHLYGQIDVGGNETSKAVTQLLQTSLINGMVTVSGVLDLSEFTPGDTQTLNVRLMTTGTATHSKGFASNNRRQHIMISASDGTFS